MALLSTVLLIDTLANRPAAGSAGRIFYASDKGAAYRDNGASWDSWNPTGLVTTKGDLLVGTGSAAVARLGVGTDGLPLVADSSQASGLNYGNIIGGTAFAPSGLTGSVAASRYVGATASGAPASGAHLLGDFVIDQTGKVWVCTTAGTPGTWTQAGGSSITTAQAQLGADVAITTANTFYDGPSVSLAAGTWLVAATVTVNGQVQSVTAKVWDGTTVYASAEGGQAINVAGFATAVTIVCIITLGGSATIKVSATSQGGGAVIKAATLHSSAGNTATTMSAAKLA